MKEILKTALALSIFLFASPVLGANLSIQKSLPSNNDLKVGDEILLNLTMSSDGAEHNAIEGSLKIPPIFEVKGVVTGDSFVTIWLEDPSNFKDNVINFSGITPAGYNKETGLVFSVILKALAQGGGNITSDKVILYKNDGLGTSESLASTEFPLRIRGAIDGEAPYLIGVQDTTPPEDFKIELIKRNELFGGKSVIIWSTRDLGSGIKSYDVFEGRKVFKQVTSPYVLENQHLNGKIKVIAYDQEKNTRVVSLVPPGRVCLGVDCFSRTQSVFVLVVITILTFILWRKSRK